MQHRARTASEERSGATTTVPPVSNARRSRLPSRGALIAPASEDSSAVRERNTACIETEHTPERPPLNLRRIADVVVPALSPRAASSPRALPRASPRSAARPFRVISSTSQQLDGIRQPVAPSTANTGYASPRMASSHLRPLAHWTPAQPSAARPMDQSPIRTPKNEDGERGFEFKLRGAAGADKHALLEENVPRGPKPVQPVPFSLSLVTEDMPVLPSKWDSSSRQASGEVLAFPSAAPMLARPRSSSARHKLPRPTSGQLMRFLSQPGDDESSHLPSAVNPHQAGSTIMRDVALRKSTSRKNVAKLHPL